MKFVLPLSTAIFFVAATVSASDNAVSLQGDGDSAPSALPVSPAVLASVKTLWHMPSFLTIFANVTADDEDSENYPDYCDDDPKWNCFKKGVPKCCKGKKKSCPEKRPQCDKGQGRTGQHPPTRRPTRIPTTHYVSPGERCRPNRGDVCIDGYKCIDRICQHGPGPTRRPTRRPTKPTRPPTPYPTRRPTHPTRPPTRYPTRRPTNPTRPPTPYPTRRPTNPTRPPTPYPTRRPTNPTRPPTSYPTKHFIGPGESCRPNRGDSCADGYECINSICQIPANGRCERGDLCVSGYQCTNGRCSLRRVPRDGACVSGVDTCQNDDVCFNGYCGPGMWYSTNHLTCVLDCRSSDGICCGGRADSWIQTYMSVDACCSQSQTSWNFNDCVSDSLTCATTIPIDAGGRCERDDVCVDGYDCTNGRCRRPIDAGGRCEQGDVCVDGYECANGRCSLRLPARPIDAGGRCERGDVCVNGYECANGRCSLRQVPIGGACVADVDVCEDGSVCFNGQCGSGTWYSRNSNNCVLDCRSSDGSCCGGRRDSWMQTYISVDACCSQSSTFHRFDACVLESFSCLGEDLEIE